MDSEKLCCKACTARKAARTGLVTVEPYPFLYHLLLEMKDVMLKPGNAATNLKSKWHPVFMPVFDAIHVMADGRRPSFQHISPTYEVKGQAKGFHAWEFRLMSGESLGDMFERVFVGPREAKSVAILPSGTILSAIPCSVFFRVRAKHWYSAPLRCLPKMQITLDTVVLVTVADPAGGPSSVEWRWPDGIEYDDASKQATKRYVCSTVSELGAAQNLHLDQAVLAEITRWL